MRGLSFASLGLALAACGGRELPTPLTTYDPDAAFDSSSSSGDAGDHVDAPAPIVPVFLSAAGQQTCALFSDGSMKCWGRGSQQAPNESRAAIATPTRVSGAPLASQVSVGWEAICLLSQAGGVDCFGDDTRGAVGDGQADGGVLNVYAPTPVNLPAATLQVDVEFASPCAVASDGSVRCWGDNTYGQLGASVPQGQFSASPVVVAGAPSAQSIAAYKSGACILAQDNSVDCWGGGAAGELGDGMSGVGHSRATVGTVQGLPANVVRIAAGEEDVCATTSDGDLWCWGDNTEAQLGQGSPGAPATTPQRINLANVEQVAIGTFDECAVITDGTVQCWGGSELGVDAGGPSNGASTYQPPTRMPGLPLAQQVVVANQHACVLGRDATVWCWGANDGGQLGPNAPIAFDPPTLIPL
jgi:alpha-tubulin suppressor-like RCC1 family protein